MASIGYRIRSNSDKPVSIMIYISLGRGQIFECKTGFLIHPLDWDTLSNRPNKNTSENKGIFLSLRKLERHLYKAVNESAELGAEINTEWLENEIRICFTRSSGNIPKKASLSQLINQDKEQPERAIANYLIRESQKTLLSQSEFYQMVIDSAQHELKMMKQTA